ncbi:uncharacterized protein LOC103313405 [Tribolium castaneum]|uniref:Uncharacterized protein n=1 Tax=Tribolium castaneum TaxID=7070 RepID=D2A696_TRICA|nr:PREDICTED: uncharacterized protein LOC103313405 [Tribolium castaneum]EFA04958.1 hypothetical protein TcasGA2_TC015027 [Tribolium castaneum]|eukprot:XP_015836459.1 PREDICTED: uncharacterized protein LOC103313405 [Tribolium castaneum]
MRLLFALVFTILAVRADVRVCDIKCEPEDEFLDAETGEWDDFMDELVAKTFEEGRMLPCSKDPTQLITVDPGDDIVWDLRFKIYSERKIIGEKTLNDCYCDFTDCKSEEFRQCLASARIAMKNDINTVLVRGIGQYLLLESLKC